MLGISLIGVSLCVCQSLSLHLYVSMSLCLTRLNKMDYNTDCLAATLSSKRKKPWDKANAEDKKNQTDRNWVFHDINELPDHTVFRTASNFCS